MTLNEKLPNSGRVQPPFVLSKQVRQISFQEDLQPCMAVMLLITLGHYFLSTVGLRICEIHNCCFYTAFTVFQCSNT